MHGSTFLLGPSIFDRRKARKILIFFISLSLSVFPLCPSLFVCLFLPLFPSFPSVSHRIPTFFMFIPLSFFHLIFLSYFLLIFSSLSFSLLFLISLLLLFDPHPSTKFVKKWGKLPPLSSMPDVITMFFFLIFFFPFITSCNT